ncbi:MAG: hypothetical protein P4L42_16755 [Desulfocapsaceae bacterium]|nr:hypothetical protein [Desulfocapsaceae bacterium]
MKRLQFLIFSVLAFALTGCGHTVIETLNVPNGPSYNGVGKGRVVVILPFADYTYADTLASAHRRYLKVNESLNDRLTAYGFSLPVQEDVFQYMVEQNFISLAQYEQGSNSLSNELSGDWSDKMKDQISHYIQAQQITNSSSLAASPGTHGLTTKGIMKIGSNFHAAYIMRGRILEYKTRQEVSWEPWKKGILPVVVGGTSQMFFGFAKSEDYDEANSIVTGGALGAWYGSSQSWPVDKTASGLLGTSGPNTVIWGAAGSYLGSAAHNSGKIDQAVVQLSVTVQEAATGKVVWSNRVQVQISPESVFADSQYDVLFNEAIEKGISSLVDNFVTHAM